MSRVRRRALLVAAAVLTVAGTVAIAPSASAHACVGAKVAGTPTPTGCHTPPTANCADVTLNASNWVIVCHS